MVFLHVLHLVLRYRQFPLDPGAQQVPVRTSPAVDSLFHVADNQAVMSPGQGILHQRAEILPLERRGILELIQQEMLITDAHFLINERCIRPVDDAAKKCVRVVQGQHVFLFLDLGQRPSQFPGDAESVELVPDQACGRVDLVRLAEKRRKTIQRAVQLPFKQAAIPVLGFREPLRSVRRIGEERRRRPGNRIAGAEIPVGVEGLQEAPH